MLRDIGLTQGDVRSAMAIAGVGDDPSYRLGVMSRERRAAFRAQARDALRPRVPAGEPLGRVEAEARL